MSPLSVCLLFFFPHQVFESKRAATIHNIISASTDQHLEPLPTQLPPRPRRCLSVVAAATHDSPPPPPHRHHHRHHDATTIIVTTTPTPPRLQECLRRRRYLSTPAVDNQPECGGGGGNIGCRRRPSCSYARPRSQEEGGGKPHVNRHRRRQTSSLASRQSSYVRPVNFTTSIEMRGDSSDSEDDELEYGYRDSRRRTSYEQRGSSSLTPAQIMEQESYYDYATMAFERSMYFLRLIVLHRAVYASLCSLVGRWSVSNVASAASVVEAARAKMKRILDAVHRLFFILQWIRGHGEVALLYAEDLTVYVRRRHRFTPARCRRINDIRSQDCYPWFSHNPHSLG